MNKLTAEAYREAFRAMFAAVKSDHPQFAVGKTLLGILTDWSDTQLRGIEEATSKEMAATVVKGCQVSMSACIHVVRVHFMNVQHSERPFVQRMHTVIVYIL